jgi:hypothetical protein
MSCLYAVPTSASSSMRSLRSTLVVLPLLGACYRYEPIAVPTPAVGGEFRSYLTPAGTETLATTLGRDVGTVDGRLLSEDPSQFRFAVTRTQTREARLTSWSGEAISLPRASVARMEAKVLDRRKTFRAVALSVGGAVLGGLLFSKLATNSSGSGGTGTPPPPP